MKQEENQTYEHIRIHNVCVTKTIRIELVKSKPWSALSIEEYQECISAVRHFQQLNPHHKTVFSSSKQAYVELIPPSSLLAATPTLHVGGTQDPLYPSIRTLLKRSSRIDIITAFIQDSGLRILQPIFFDALHRGAHIKILGGDYLHITQVDALRRLVDWLDQQDLTDNHGLLSVKISQSSRMAE